MLLPNAKRTWLILSALLVGMMIFVLHSPGAPPSLYAQGATPGKPGTPEKVGATSSAMLVKWAPPSDVGPGITGWEVQRCTHGSGCPEMGTGSWAPGQQDAVSGPDSNGDYSVILRGLSAHGAYLVRVRAESSGGDGP